MVADSASPQFDVRRTDEFERSLSSLPPQIRRLVEVRIALFRQSPHQPPRILRASPLRNREEWHFRVNIQYRIWYRKEHTAEGLVYWLTWVGSHAEQDSRLG